MTNEALLELGRTIEINDKDEWLVEGRIVLVCRPDINDNNSLDKYAVLFHDNMRVGIVYFMGSYDIHVLTFPEHRNKGYMSHFMRSGVIGLVEPELKISEVSPFNDDYEASKHLVELAGLIPCKDKNERDEIRRKIKEQAVTV